MSAQTRGYLYILYNEVFEKYKEEYAKEVYKLGRTNNCETRLKHYTTSYVKPSSFLYTSSLFDNAIQAERILFYLLRYYRIRDKREFFTCDLGTVIQTIKQIESYTSLQIERIYNRICAKLSPERLIESLEDKDDEYSTKLQMSINDVCKSLERFRFKPRHPEKYGYITEQQRELVTLSF